MSKTIGIAFVFASAASSVLGKVVTLTQDNFNTVVRENGNVLVKFYAPWCGHCKTMAPHYEAASTQVGDAVLAEIDCDMDDNRDICGEFGIRGFPTLKYFPKVSKKAEESEEAPAVEPIEYDGGRTEETIVQWVTDIQKPVVQVVEAMPEVGSKLQVVFEGAEVSDAFTQTAEKNRKYAYFYHVKTESEAVKCTILKSGDEPIVVEEPTLENLLSAVDEHRFPYFGELNAETYGDYTSREGKKMFWTLLDFGDKEMAEAVAAVEEDMTAVAKQYKDYSFTYTDTVQFAGAIEGMLGVSSFPAVVVQDGAKKYVQSGEVTKDSVSAFLDGIAAGKIEPTIKSEEIPETQDNAVKYIVAKSMQSELFNDRDVLLKVYAPWCGHCQTMAPDYEAAAVALTDLGVGDAVTLGKMDGTLNDSTVDGLEWQGFPTIVFVPAGSDKHIEYEGGRSKEEILAWIAENSTQDKVKEALTSDKVAAVLAKAAEEKEAAELAAEDDVEEEDAAAEQQEGTCTNESCSSCDKNKNNTAQEEDGAAAASEEQAGEHEEL